jgi:small subunit ribosomal protein S8e
LQYAQPVTRGLKSTTDEAAADKKQSSHVQRILEERKKDAKIDPLLEQQFKAGRLLAAITSRPGQSGRADGHILEGKELDVSRMVIVKGAMLTH